MPYDRIDVHTHLIPPFWAEALKDHGGDPSGWGSPEWSPETLLRFMDANGIAVSMLSLTRAGDRRLAWARACRHGAPGK